MDTTRAQSDKETNSTLLDALATARSLVDSFPDNTPPVVNSQLPDISGLSIVEPSEAPTDQDLLKDHMRSNIVDLTAQVIENCNEDRLEYTEVITRIKKHIESKDVIHSGAVKTLLEAIKGRSEVNATKVRMIDVCNKVLSGGKPSMINNNVGAVSAGVNKELIDLLSN